jgi:hypothetical protein
MLPFTQTSPEPGTVTVGNAFTVTVPEDELLEQPVVVLVNVISAEPPATPVTTPALVIVAVPVALLDQVPPVVGDNVIVLPTHTVPVPGTVTVGAAVTATEVELELDVQPLTVTSQLYVPAIAEVADAIVGSSFEEINVFGPVQA